MGAKTSKVRDPVLEELRRRRLALEQGRTQDEGSGYICSSCSKQPQPHYRCHLGCDFDLCGACRKKCSHPHPLIRERMSPSDKKQAVSTAAITTSDLLLNACALFAKRPCFAKLTPQGQLLWLTFRDVYLRVCSIGRALRARLKRSDFVAIGGENCAEWLICDYACQLFGLVSVPLHTHLPADKLAFIMQQCKPSLVLVSRSVADKLGSNFSLPTFLLDAPQSDPRSLYALEAEGRNLPLTFDPRTGNELLTVVWTSGSTGDSKGVMISEELYFDETEGPWFLPYDLRRVFFSPLAHTTDRKNATIGFVNGGQCLLYPGPIENLWNVIALVRPTAFAAPPRLWNELYNQYQEAMMKEAADKAKVQADFRRMLGGQVRTAATGGAPITPAVRFWIEECFQLELTIAYGSTESGGIASRERARPGIQFRLIPLPELGYMPHDVPNARGEIAVKKSGIMGYWGDDARNASAFTTDGYYKTGDIGELRPDGTIAIIGRVGGSVKLAQSEWVNAEGIEAELSTCTWVQQIYVHAESIRSYVVAVVVPSDAALASFLQGKFEASMRTDLCARADVRAAALAAVAAHAVKAKLRSWEIPRAVFLEPARFSLQNGRLTPSHKLARAVLARAYASALNTLYADYDAECNRSTSSIVDLIAQCGVSGVAVSGTTRLADIGVDSIAALRLRAMLKAKTGADVSLESLLGQPLSEISKALTMPAIASAPLPYTSIDWAAETKLPPLVLPALQQNDGGKHRVFLTGATGFVGAYVLHTLVAKGVYVVCLVRSSNDQQATKRLTDVMAKFGLVVDSNRVEVVVGDVSEERFGFAEEQYAALAASVTLIIHAGATVSAVLPYSHQRRANVVGTVNILRFATQTRLKAVHHVSTMSVFSSAEKAVGAVDERTEPHVAHVASRPAYGQSKWVAEKLVRVAAELGVPCAIYRLAGVGVGCSQLGAAPDMADSTFDITPVDWVAAALVSLVLFKPFPEGHRITYHLTSPKGAVPFAELVAACARAKGPIKTVPFGEWRKMLDTADATNVLVPLRHCFIGPLGSAGNYRCELTTQVLQQAAPALQLHRLPIRKHVRWAMKSKPEAAV